MMRLQRLRLVLLGTVVGVGLTVAIGVLLGLFVGWNGVDAGDATRVADRWAAAHRTPIETYRAWDCETDAGGYSFACRVSFEPTGRNFTLFLRKTAPHGRYEVVLWRVRKGIVPRPGFQ
jgi:hypothetical protein